MQIAYNVCSHVQSCV